MKNSLIYPAKIEKRTDDGIYYLVEFPDLPGCFTQGDNLRHAKEMAKEALSLYLDTLQHDNKVFPVPSELAGKDIYYITGALGKSTTYSEYHKKSYEKNREKVLLTKKSKESELKAQGYKTFKEMFHRDTIERLNRIAKTENKTRRQLISELINHEYERIVV